MGRGRSGGVRASDGAFWYVADSPAGDLEFVRFHHGQQQRIPQSDGLASSGLVDLIAGAQGSVWDVIDNIGVNGRIRRLCGLPTGFSRNAAIDGRGRLWFTYQTGKSGPHTVGYADKNLAVHLDGNPAARAEDHGPLPSRPRAGNTTGVPRPTLVKPYAVVSRGSARRRGSRPLRPRETRSPAG